MSDKLYVVHGAGNDAVGLVERITTRIAEVGGNIIDLRQDSLHGLFTIYLVTDLSGSDLRLERFSELIAGIGEDTGLSLHASRYVPTPRSADPRSLLLTLLGRDRPGIISTVSRDLSSHKINIEFARMIAREGIFLMELLTDVSHSSLPPENLESTVREHMAAMGIASMFQWRDVFHPKKRIILFDISGSLSSREDLAELTQQAGMSPDSLPENPAGALEGLPLEVFSQVVRSLQVSPDTLELVRALKRMGCRTALRSRAYAPVTELLKERLGLDYCFGAELGVDHDSQTLTGTAGELGDTAAVVAFLAAAEGVDPEDVSVLADRPGDPSPPGIRLTLDMRLVLDYLNQHVLSRETLGGILGSLGTVPA
ncbi:MAG: ACT domain-containing protein [Candidatus Eremiobacterota bacterium]